MNQEDIKKLLPHRDPFLFIDNVTLLKDQIIHANRIVQESDFYFKGHYPGNPITPGVILLETIFQSGALLIASLKDVEISGSPVVTRVNNVKFKNIVRPNDLIEIESSLIEKIGSAYRFNGKIKVNEKLAVSCEYMATMV